VTPMYSLTISVPGGDAETSLHDDVESTIDALRAGLGERVEPGRKVRWEIGCPSGRSTAGQITINHLPNTARDVARHLQTVNQVLTEEATDAART
jgi:hypothetical protein